jgi:hypothetical protein
MFAGAELLGAGRSPYDVAALRSAPFGGHYIYPPLFAWLLAPLTALPVVAVARGWVVLSQALYFGGFAIVCRRVALQAGSAVFSMAVLLLLVFQPAFDSFLGGQLDALVLLLLALAWPSSRTAGAVSGSALALACALKVYPVVPVCGLVARARWRALAWFGGASLVLWAAPGVPSGWRPTAQFVVDVAPAISSGTAWLENQSLFGLFARMFVDGSTVSSVAGTPLPAAAVLARIAGVVVLAMSVGAGSGAREDRTLFSTLVTATLLVIPNSWMHYEVILLLPLLDLLGREVEHPSGLWGRGLLAAAAAGIALGNEDTLLRHPWLPQSYKAWAMLLLWGLGMRAMARARPGGPVRSSS